MMAARMLCGDTPSPSEGDEGLDNGGVLTPSLSPTPHCCTETRIPVGDFTGAAICIEAGAATADGKVITVGAAVRQNED
jgi:hypothetical protein